MMLCRSDSSRDTKSNFCHSKTTQKLTIFFRFVFLLLHISGFLIIVSRILTVVQLLQGAQAHHIDVPCIVLRLLIDDGGQIEHFVRPVVLLSLVRLDVSLELQISVRLFGPLLVRPLVLDYVVLVAIGQSVLDVVTDYLLVQVGFLALFFVRNRDDAFGDFVVAGFPG